MLLSPAVPLTTPRGEAPIVAKVSLSGPLKPREGRGCLVLLTWGSRLSPHLPLWEES